MKRKILSVFIVSIVIIGGSQSLNAQSWKFQSGKIYADPKKAKVGIGTSIPSSKLHINATTNTQDGLRVQIDGYTRLFLRSNGGLSVGNYATPPSRGLYVYGNVGIGTRNPKSTLHVYKSNHPVFHLSSSRSTLEIAIAKNQGNYSPGSKAGDVVFRTSTGNAPNGMVFNINNESNDGTSYIKFGDNHNGLWFQILNNKKVTIDGTLYAKKIRVQLPPFPDYVFSKNYSLMPLNQLEKFISKNGHLPNIPSSKEVEKDGIGVGELQIKQMEKIEELTLYILQLKGEIDNLKSQLEGVKK